MDELAQLQALLGAVQKQETKYKLNERNCKELVLKLIEKGLVELIVTLDAKEYVTPKHLEKEILDEIIVHGGRVSLTEIQPTLNVDLKHVQNRFDEIMKADPSFRLVDGVVFTSEYLDGLAEEVNQLLQESGQLRLVELAANFNVTTQFLIEVLNPRIGTIVQGHCESGILFTSTYIQRQTACIRGAFSAITRPTPVSTLQSTFHFDETLFEANVLKLIEDGRLKGTLSGRGMRATYIPAIFADAQLAAVRQFFQQNAYIEYRTAERMLVTNPKAFLARELGDAGFALSTCYASRQLLLQVL